MYRIKGLTLSLICETLVSFDLKGDAFFWKYTSEKEVEYQVDIKKKEEVSFAATQDTVLNEDQ